MYHTETLGLQNVLYVVGTSGNVIHDGILYACLIAFSASIRHAYTHALDSIYSACFEWVGRD